MGDVCVVAGDVLEGDRQLYVVQPKVNPAYLLTISEVFYKSIKIPPNRSEEAAGVYNEQKCFVILIRYQSMEIIEKISFQHLIQCCGSVSFYMDQDPQNRFVWLVDLLQN